MGPTALFDKSFLQSISVDESVWFDAYFYANVCPIFYIETLADLAKKRKRGNPGYVDVKRIAEKFPEMHGGPNAFHINLGRADLFGNSISMDGRIVREGGRLVQAHEGPGVVFEQSEEERAFQRWQEGQFRHLEHEFAARWRLALQTVNAAPAVRALNSMGVTSRTCGSFGDARNLSARFVASFGDGIEFLDILMSYFSMAPDLKTITARRWISHGAPPISTYARYATFVFEVEMFFQFSMASGLVSKDKSSNRTDISYLFYFPFCNVFVSSDLLHKRIAEHFLTKNQQFVWGPDLRQDLADINRVMLEIPQHVKDNGVLSFVADPPGGDNSLVVKLWDRFSPDWRPQRNDTPYKVFKPIKGGPLLERVNKMADAPALAETKFDIGADQIRSMIVKRTLRKKRGSWNQVGRDIKIND
jgi:hypothetical protein